MTVPVFTIEDADDARLSAYRGLKERDVLNIDGRYVAEGRFIAEKALGQNRFPLRSILVLEKHLGKVLAMLDGQATDAPGVFVASPDVINAVAGFDVHRGILAEGKAGDGMALDDVTGLAGDIAVISGVSNPENIGTLFRSAAALGMSGVLLDLQSTHPLARRALRVSMGTTLTLPWARGRRETVMGALERSGRQVFALSPSAGAMIDDARFDSPSAVMFGEEAHGIDPGLMARTASLAIPMAEGVDSLNVSAAGAIIFDALRRARRHR